jgi:hypothetical protein
VAVLNHSDNCSSCLFFTEGGHIGTCKRYPNSVIKSPNEWCGEYKLFARKPIIDPIPVVVPDIEIKFVEPTKVEEPTKKRGRPARK